jgi:serine/threonine protein kinase
LAIAGEHDFHGTSRFQVQRRLGEGGMGVVYEAFDRERRSVVALKTLRAGNTDRLFRLKAEFRALADLDHHNLVRLGELICEDGQWFFTMDLIEGVDFLSYVRGAQETSAGGVSRADTMLDSWGSPGEGRSGDAPKWSRGFDEKKLRSALAQLCQGVSALHAAHKVHRDIKPSNILVTPEGRAVLLDFGLVADLAEGGQSTELRTVVGTAPYMAPEQAASRTVGPQADWYSVGVLLYEALAGQRPFLGKDLDVLMQKQHAEPPPPQTLSPAVPTDLNALCMELLRIEPGARPTGAVILERLGIVEGPPDKVSSTLSSALSQAPSFIGRRRELATLWQAFDDSLKGRAVTLLVSGESGQGKSALVRHFVDEVKVQQRALVFASRCYERESVPFKAFDGIVDALSRHLGRLDPVDAALLLPTDVDLVGRLFPVLRWVPVVGRAVPGRHHVSSPQELRTRAFAALRELLARIVQRRPLVLFVDDLQWADGDSLALLGELFYAEDAPQVLLVATVRTAKGAELEPQAALFQVLGKIAGVRRLPLSSLSVEETCALVATLLDTTGRDGSEALAIARETGGHPLFVQELVRHVQRKGGTSALGTVRLDDALRERIDALDAPAQRLLEAVAVAGVPTAQDLVVRAAAVSPGQSARWISLLRIANVVRTRGTRGSDAIEPYHDRVREAVIARLSDEDLKRLHLGLADALEEGGLAAQDPRLLVSHLAAAGEAERAAVHAERAARLAADGLAFDQAAELYRMALRLGHYDAADVRRLRRALAETLVAEGRGPEAAEDYLLAAEGAEIVPRLDCQRRAAEQLLLCGHHERGFATLEAVLSEVGVTLPRTPRRALLSLIWQRIKLRLRGLSWTEAGRRAPLLADLRRLDVYQSVAAGLAMVDTIRGADFQARCLLLALRLGERRSIGRALAMEAVFLCSQGGKSLARGRHLADRVGKIAEESQDSYLRGYALTGAGMGSFFAGDFHETARLLGAAETTLKETAGTVWELSSIRLFRLLALRHVGALRELRRTFDEYVRDAARRGDRYAETTLTRMFNWVWLARDAPAEAHRDLAQKPWTPPERGFHVQHWYELRARVELELYEGKAQGALLRHGERFDRLSRSMLLRVQTIRADAVWLRGRVLLVGSAISSNAPVLEAVSRLSTKLAKEQVGYARVWGLLLGATVAYQRRAVDDAHARLSAAIELSDANRLALLAACARMRLGQLCGGSEGAALCAEGEAWMASENIRNPVRMLEVVTPGFGPES